MYLLCQVHGVSECSVDSILLLLCLTSPALGQLRKLPNGDGGGSKSVAMDLRALGGLRIPLLGVCILEHAIMQWARGHRTEDFLTCYNAGHVVD